jgi:hypothetical protein
MLYYCHDEISMFLLQSSNQISNQDIQNICIHHTYISRSTIVVITTQHTQKFKELLDLFNSIK